MEELVLYVKNYEKFLYMFCKFSYLKRWKVKKVYVENFRNCGVGLYEFIKLIN